MITKRTNKVNIKFWTVFFNYKQHLATTLRQLKLLKVEDNQCFSIFLLFVQSCKRVFCFVWIKLVLLRIKYSIDIQRSFVNLFHQLIFTKSLSDHANGTCPVRVWLCTFEKDNQVKFNNFQPKLIRAHFYFSVYGHLRAIT